MKKDNIAWKFFLTVIPITLIPVFVVTFVISHQIYSHLEEEHRNFYSTLLKEAGNNLDDLYNVTLNKIVGIMSTKMFRKVISGNVNQDNFDKLSEITRIGSENNLYLGPFKSELGANILFNSEGMESYLSVDKLTEEPLFKYLKNNSPHSSVLGRFSEDIYKYTYNSSSKLIGILVPYYQLDRDGFDFFVVSLANSMYFDQVYNDIGKINRGTIYILDNFNNIITKNHPGKEDYYSFDDKLKKYVLEYEDDEKVCPFTGLSLKEYGFLNADSAILENDKVKLLLDGVVEGKENASETKGSVIVKHNNIRYLTIAIRAADSKAKLIYFYPLSFIYKPINRILKIILYITLGIIGLIAFFIFVIGKIFAKPIEEKQVLLENDNKLLLETNEQKTNFFINLAHETKTPLTLINNYIDKYKSKVRVDEDLEIVHKNIKILTRNITNFLDIEKLQKGEISFNHEQIICLSDILNDKIKLFDSLANKLNIQVNSSIKDNLYIKADPFAIDRILNNLLDNAIKYNKNNGSVSIFLDNLKNNVLLRITDTGIGISEDQKNNIFKPYYQIKQSKKNYQGLGMGLSIIKNIVDNLGGNIKIDSEVDFGTTFTVTFNEHPLRDGDIITSDFLVTAPLENTHSNIRIKDVEFKQNNKTILIVEDNIEIINFLIETLNTDYNIFYALDGQEALNKIKTIPFPDIIISDVMMDNMDGIDFYKVIRNEKDFNSIPFIFLTAKSQTVDEIEGLQLGAVDYIKKPFSISVLKAKIDSIVAHQDLNCKKNYENMEKNLVDFLRESNSKSPEEKRSSEYYHFDKMCNEFNISKREKEVAGLLLEGLQYKEIAYELNISEKTVSAHVHKIYSKSNVQNRAEFINLIK